MKILDRYLVGTFLKNYLLSLVILIGLYVIVDMLFNFSSLMSIDDTTRITGLASIVRIIQQTAGYYAYQVFVYYAQLSGVIPVVAAAFTLMRMSSYNELCALLASGVPLIRVAMPIILCAVLFNGLLLVDEELVIPRMIPKLIRTHGEASQTEVGNVYAIPTIPDGNNLLVAGRYFSGPGNPTIDALYVIERNAQLEPVAYLTADRARWDPDLLCWQLTGGKIVRGLASKESVDNPQPFPGPYHGSVTPQEISLYTMVDHVNLWSTSQIDQLLANPGGQTFGIHQLLRVKNDRFTQPLINVILLLLTIPCVLTSTPGRLHAATSRCIILSALCMGSVFLCHMLASSPPTSAWAATWPAIAAWIPIFIFAPVSVLMLDRLES